MAWFNRLTRRWRHEEDLQDEIQSHLAMATRDRVSDGAEPRAAELGALKEFGNVTLTTEAAKRVWSSWWIEAAADLLNDFRYAFRVLRRSPGFSLIVVVVLALGIGLNAAVFTLFKSLALKPIAGVDGSASLGVVVTKTSGGQIQGLSYPDLQDIRKRVQSFSGLAGSTQSNFTAGFGSRGERVRAELVTGNYFQLLGVRATLGRTLLPSDDEDGQSHAVVVLSDGVWRRIFGADPNVVGRPFRINGYPLTVVGVAEPAFHGALVGLETGVFVPVTAQPQVQPPSRLSDRSLPTMAVFGRLLPGVSLSRARSEMSAISAELAATEPREKISERALILTMSQSPFGAQTYMVPAVLVLGAMGALLLLIVCANVAGLMLVRGISRRGEIAVRLALGASRARVLRLLFVENLVLAVPGAAMGLLLSWRVLPVLWEGVMGIASGLVFLDLSVDGTVIAFAVTASCASAVLFGFVPAVRSSRMDLVSVMKDDSSPRGAARGRFRAALVVAQVAVSLLLLIGAGLVARSFDAARRADAGFDANGVVAMWLDLLPSSHDENRGRAFYQQLLDRINADPNIEVATLAGRTPMTFVDADGRPMVVEGYDPRRDEDLIFGSNIVGPDYFRTLRIGLESGREFSPQDVPSAIQVAIVNETFARRFWGSPAAAVGKRIRLVSAEWRTVVGVVRDVKYARINESPRPYAYFPLSQSYQPSMYLHVRGATYAAGDAGIAALVDQVRGHVRALDADVPIVRVVALSRMTSIALAVFDMTARALAMFGGVAIILAALGIYGLVSYTVKQSTHEIGIRMALGAQRGDVVRRFLARGIRLGTIGALLGMAVAFAATRFLGAVLFGVSPTDAFSFLGASVVVLSSVLVAAIVPAWRASRTNPIAALRHQ